MNQQQEQLATLHEIRNIMDRSSRFISLSGLSGVFAGLFALAGVALVTWYLNQYDLLYRDIYSNSLDWNTTVFLLTVAGLVLLLALGSAIYFTYRKAQKNNHRIWDSKSQRLLVNLAIPLAVGGFFCAILLYHGLVYLVAPAMLVFYGLALVNGSKYTLRDIYYLGLSEIVLGLFAAVFIGYGLLAWAVGFGLLHIVYGTLMYYKYER
ncbi:hypothetical protein H9Q13_06735 [Pontibacter sp. JH31]|uniref:Beta-carotene 15,15'-monooxygenase n=1 Tax=Pontibacter aquaedesilientis TaxID=2766980 RepID=A0ABR7XEY4_9BACT|nr:hypothetical protein [Pontibacter aquaedesilientis]MBD1396855.1 hypothetical protein [Pontibacter aquaedesilientis]